MRADPIPALIVAAGPAAGAAYHALVADPARAPSTRRVYRSAVGRFLRWAEERGRTLGTLTAADWDAFAATVPPAAAGDIHSPLTRLFDRLVAAGVRPDNPFPRGRPGPTSRAGMVPEFIAAVGDDAARAYREFLAGSSETAAARVRRFVRWAGRRGLTLEAIDAAAVVAYRAELARATSSQNASEALSPARALLRHLARAGVLPSDPCPARIPRPQGACPTREAADDR